MSELSAFGAHARAMATATHKPGCVGQYGVKEHRVWTEQGGIVQPAVEPWCHGCVTDADRALWTRLADEVDAYLSHEEEGLFA